MYELGRNRAKGRVSHMSDELVAVLARHRGKLQAALDVVAWFVAVHVALWLRFESRLDLWSYDRVLGGLAIAVVAQLCAGRLFGLYHRRFRYASFEEAAAMTYAVASSTVAVFVVASLAWQPRLLPVSVSVGAGLVAGVLMAASRYVFRAMVWRRLRPNRAQRVLVFGAGEAGESLVTAMLRNPVSPLLPVAFLDDDARKGRLRVRGVPVVGDRHAMAEAAAKYDATKLVIAVPSGDRRLYRELSHLALQAKLPVAVLPAVEELLAADGTVDIGVGDVRPLQMTDLLGRPRVETDIDQVAGYITGRRVLVTGAGGSIGSELCRQLHRLGPAELVMLDRDESALHKVQLELEGKALLDSRNLVVADIRDAERMLEVFAEHRPHVVFHAAALKHLPLLEMHPGEGVKTNIWGTWHVLHAAVEHGVDRFVNVSTDKAADPCSVLGYTKRIAERLTAHVAAEAEGTYLSVRFGNVLGSRGSVLETFRAQIAAGGPVTVVDPQVTRYFMLVEEAVQLVIQAGAIGHDGEALVLDMGDPVSIDEVARQLIAQADRPIEIVYTGLRPGEKMHEALFGLDEIGVVREHELISHVAVPELSAQEITPGQPDDLHDHLRRLSMLGSPATTRP